MFVLFIESFAFAEGGESSNQCGPDDAASLSNFEISTDTLCGGSFDLGISYNPSAGSIEDPDGVVQTISVLVNGNYVPFYIGNTTDVPSGTHYDISDSTKAPFGGVLPCGQTLSFEYKAKWCDSTSITVTKNVHVCQTLYSVQISPSNGFTTCDDSVLLNTNLSGNSNIVHTWTNAFGDTIGIGPNVWIDTSGYYRVIVDDPNVACDSGFAWGIYNINGFSTSISSDDGTLNLNCSNVFEGTPQDFPTFSLNNHSSFQSNYSFQWYYTPPGGTIKKAPFGTNHELLDIGYPGTFFLVTTNNQTGCVDTSNAITITASNYNSSYTLNPVSDTTVCQGSSYSATLSFQPTPVSQSTWEVFDGSSTQGSSLTLLDEGSYWSIITEPSGCYYFTDTLNLDIDTIPLPNDNINMVGGNGQGIFTLGSLVTFNNLTPANTTLNSYELYLDGQLVKDLFLTFNSIDDYQLNSAGCFQLQLLTRSNFGCVDTTIDETICVFSNSCNINLGGLIPLHGVINPGNYANHRYLISDDLTTIPNTSYFFYNCDFYFIGDAFSYIGNGGEATGPNIYLAPGVDFTCDLSSFQAACDTMWGGIFIGDSANLNLESSILQDSYNGLVPDVSNLNAPPSSDEKYGITGGTNQFLNNYVSVTIYAHQNDTNQTDYLVPLGEFDSEPNTMLFPYDIKSNDGKESFSYKAIDVYRGNSSSTNYFFQDSTSFHAGAHLLTPSERPFKVDNHVYGIYFNPGAKGKVVANAEITNPKVAAVYSKSHSDQLILSNDTIFLETHESQSWQQAQEFDAHPKMNSRVHGVFVEETFLSFENSFITGDALSFDIGEELSYTVGIGSDNNIAILESRFEKLDFGYYARVNSIDANLQDNKFYRNHIGINVADAAELSLDLNCNHFVKDEFDGFTQYGLWIRDDASLSGDIGGIGGLGNPPPAGNSWPVDTINSPGYPHITTGTPGDVQVNDAWRSPENWYSIYSDDPSPSWLYFAYNNEFLGEDAGAVEPNSIIDRQTGWDADSVPCLNVPEIIYPLSRIGRPLNIINGIEPIEGIKVFPNPSKDVVYLEIKSGEFDRVSIEDIYGKVVFLHNGELTSLTPINLESYSPGVYFITVTGNSGKFRTRFIRE